VRSQPERWRRSSPQTVGEMDRNIDPRDEWQNRLFKLLPAEFTGLFLAGRSLIDANDVDKDRNIYRLFLVLLCLLPVFNFRVLGIRRQLKQNLVICISFIIWCLNIDLFRLSRGQVSFYLTSIDPSYSEDLTFWAPISMGLWLIIVLPLVFRAQNWDDQVYIDKLKAEASQAADHNKRQ
jgi:hypothetical protein